MALPLLAITVTLALGRDTLLRKARTLGSHVNRIAGGILVVAGAYIILYWSVELSGITAGPIASVVVMVERVSSRLTTLIGERPILWGTVFTTVAVASAATSLRARRRGRRDRDTPVTPPAHESGP